MDLNIFDRLNNNLNNNKNSFVKDFINELNNYLNKDKDNAVYNVASGLNEENKYYIVKRGENGWSKFISADELPEGIESGYRLRMKNGKYVVDEELTRQRLESKAETKREVDEYLGKCREENVDYFIKYKDEDGFDIENRETGFEFSLSKLNDLTKEQYETFQENMIINYKNGTYVVKEDL